MVLRSSWCILDHLSDVFTIYSTLLQVSSPLTPLMQALIADFEVSEGIYSQARIEDADSVCLWLGANVMLEYSCEEVY